MMANWVTVLGMVLTSCAPAAAPAVTPKPPTPSAAPTSPPAPTAAPKTAPPPAASPAVTPRTGAEQPRSGGVLYISQGVEPKSYDPIQETSLDSLAPVIPCYSGVVQHDPLEPTKVISDLAEKWEMSPDGLSYTFRFYDNVKWHDGNPFTSEDARSTLEVVRRPPRGILSPRQEWLRAVDKIEAPDKNTLKISLQNPSPSFLHNLGDGRMVIVPKHVFEAQGNMKKDIVGTGPYKFKSSIPDASFSVAKNPNYFVKGFPYLDGITWYIITDPATRFAALRTRRVQATPLGAMGLTPSQSEIILKEMSDKVNVHKYSSLIFLAFWMPYGRPPWNDGRVRRAVELAIDRPNVIKLAMEDVAYASGFMPPGDWALPAASWRKCPATGSPRMLTLLRPSDSWLRLAILTASNPLR